MTRRSTEAPVVAITLVVAATALAACGGGDAAPAARDAGTAKAVVDVRTFRFDPDPLTVAAGTTVAFINHDAIGHTVTSGTRRHPDGAFDKSLAVSTGRVTVTFSRPGRYPYFCSIHPGPGMTGVVSVR